MESYLQRKMSIVLFQIPSEIYLSKTKPLLNRNGKMFVIKLLVKNILCITEIKTKDELH